MGVGHAHGASEALEQVAAGAAGEHAAESTLALRVAAIFVIWFGAVLFGLPTLVFRQFRSADEVVPRLLRAFAGGVIVALPLVHIIPEAIADLEGLLDFPIAGCTVLFGILSLVVVDSWLAAWLAPEQYKQQILDGTSHHHHHHGSGGGGGGSSSSGHGGADDAHDHHHGQRQQPHQRAHQHGAAASGKDVEAGAAGAAAAAAAALSPEQALARSAAAAAAPHGHQCLRSLNASGWVHGAAAPVKNIRQYVTAYTMELGCCFHSVIIGVGVGVLAAGPKQLVVTLMVALAVHQGLEALALGSVLALTGFHPAKKVAMLLLYSVTTPIGIAIGIAVSSSYDPESTAARAVQGTLNGVSAGMLLYISMYQLIAEEFSREDMLVRPRLRWGMCAALLLGAAAMCVLGVWA